MPFLTIRLPPVSIVLPTAGQNFSLLNGVLFSQQMSIRGGVGPYSYSVISGPSGLSVDGSGLLSWALPILLGSPHSATIQVTSGNSSAQVAVALTVA
jgi:hypothetical protein